MSTLRKKSKSPREVPKKSPKAPKSPKKSKGSTINYPPSSSSTGSTNSAPSFPSVQEVKQSNYGTIFDAAKKGDVVQLTTLLNKGLGLLGRDDEGCTILHVAAASNQEYFLSYALSLGKINVGLVDSKGKTPLHHAILNGSVSCVAPLINAGADPFLPNKENLTPLHLAECRGGAIYQALSDALGLPPPNNPPQQHSGGPSGPGSRRLTGGGSLPRRSVQGVGGGGGGGGGGGTRQVNHSRRLSTGTSPTTRLPEDFFNPNPQNPRRLTQQRSRRQSCEIRPSMPQTMSSGTISRGPGGGGSYSARGTHSRSMRQSLGAPINPADIENQNLYMGGEDKKVGVRTIRARAGTAGVPLHSQSSFGRRSPNSEPSRMGTIRSPRQFNETPPSHSLPDVSSNRYNNPRSNPPRHPTVSSNVNIASINSPPHTLSPPVLSPRGTPRGGAGFTSPVLPLASPPSPIRSPLNPALSPSSNFNTISLPKAHSRPLNPQMESWGVQEELGVHKGPVRSASPSHFAATISSPRAPHIPPTSSQPITPPFSSSQPTTPPFSSSQTTTTPPFSSQPSTPPGGRARNVTWRDSTERREVSPINSEPHQVPSEEVGTTSKKKKRSSEMESKKSKTKPEKKEKKDKKKTKKKSSSKIVVSPKPKKTILSNSGSGDSLLSDPPGKLTHDSRSFSAEGLSNISSNRSNTPPTPPSAVVIKPVPIHSAPVTPSFQRSPTASASLPSISLPRNSSGSRAFSSSSSTATSPAISSPSLPKSPNSDPYRQSDPPIGFRQFWRNSSLEAGLLPPGLTPERGVEEMATVGLKKEVLGVMMGVVESLYSLLAGSQTPDEEHQSKLYIVTSLKLVKSLLPQLPEPPSSYALQPGVGLGGGLTDVLNNIKCFFLAKEKGREERGRGIVLALRHFVSLVLFCLFGRNLNEEAHDVQTLEESITHHNHAKSLDCLSQITHQSFLVRTSCKYILQRTSDYDPFFACFYSHGALTSSSEDSMSTCLSQIKQYQRQLVGLIEMGPKVRVSSVTDDQAGLRKELTKYCAEELRRSTAFFREEVEKFRKAMAGPFTEAAKMKAQEIRGRAKGSTLADLWKNCDQLIGILKNFTPDLLGRQLDSTESNKLKGLLETIVEAGEGITESTMFGGGPGGGDEEEEGLKCVCSSFLIHLKLFGCDLFVGGEAGRGGDGYVVGCGIRDLVTSLCLLILSGGARFRV